MILQVCLQPGPLNNTNHWPIDTIGKNFSQKLMEKDRGKNSLEESKKTDFFYVETRTDSLVDKLGDTSKHVAKAKNPKKNGRLDTAKDMNGRLTGAGQDEVDKDLVGNQYRGIGNMVRQPI